MARGANEQMARDRYDDISDPVSPYDTDGRVADIDFAHDLALGADKAMTVLSQARKLGNTAVAQLAELRAEMYELQYFRPALLTVIDQGMAKVRESKFDDDERSKHFERMALYIDITERRNAIQDEVSALYQEHGEKDLVASYDRLHRTSIKERKESIRAGVIKEALPYSSLSYSSTPNPEHSTILRKELPAAILTGIDSLATELLNQYGVEPNKDTVWGRPSKRPDSLAGDLSEHIIKNYHGTLGQVKIEEVPLSEEQKREYILSGLAPRGIYTESLKRLRVSVQHLKFRSGDVFGQADILMYVIFDEEKGDYVSCTRKMAGEWRENTASLERNQDSHDRAVVLEADALTHPTSGGLPTLGK